MWLLSSLVLESYNDVCYVWSMRGALGEDSIVLFLYLEQLYNVEMPSWVKDRAGSWGAL